MTISRNLAIATLIVVSAAGLKILMPKKMTKSIYNPTETSGRAYILDESYGDGFKQLKNQQKYIKKNNEAIIFWVGGPKFGKNWHDDMKDYAFQFGKSKNSEDLAKNIVPGNYSMPFDVYVGVQPQWEGIQGSKYFEKEYKSSLTTGFINEMSQRPVTWKDVIYNKKLQSKKQQIDKMEQVFKDTAENMYELAKDLKKLGYEKVHFIAHSYGTFIVSEYIKRYGDKAFSNVDSIRLVATRLKAQKEITESFDGKSFPYVGYDEKTKKYTKIIKAPISKNAITMGIAIPSFISIVNKDYITPYKNLSDQNKEKVKIITTDYDFRLGSLQENELSLKNEGIDIKVIPDKILQQYQHQYLAQKKLKFPTEPKKDLHKKGINHHDTLLRWYLDNSISKWGLNKNWLTREPFLISDQTYWCSLRENSKEKILDQICIKK